MILSDHACTELDMLLQTSVERGDVPGVVALVADRNQVLYQGAAGHLDEQGAQAMSVNALFRILSMTKPVTSVAIMMLCEQGRLTLEDPVGHYLPDLVGREVLLEFNEAAGSYTSRPAARAVTIRDLLTHTAGFGYNFSNHILAVLCSDGKRSPRDLPLLHEPGSRWTYGMSTRILGEIIERVTGAALDAFFAVRLFQPLGMNDTGFTLNPQDRHRLASLFRRIDGRLVGTPRSDSYTPYIAGDAGLLSTAADYVRFLQMLLNGGRYGDTQLLTADTVKALTNNQIGSLRVQTQPGAIPHLSKPFPLGAGADTFSLAFQLKEGNAEYERSHGSYSWAGLFNTHFWADPQAGIAAILLLQVLPFYDDSCIRLLKDFEHHIYRNLS